MTRELRADATTPSMVESGSQKVKSPETVLPIQGAPKKRPSMLKNPKLRTAVDVAIQPLLRQNVVCERWEAIVKRSTS